MTTLDSSIEFKMHFRKIQGAFNALQSIKQLLTTPCLTAALACLVTTNELLGMGNMSLLRLVLARATLLTLLSQMEIFCVVSWIFLDAPKSQFNDACCHFVQEVTVMGNYNHSAIPA